MPASRDPARLALTLALVVAAPCLRAQDLCARCHASLTEPRLRGPVAAVADSAHRSPEVGCAGCHGGLRGEPTVRAHDPAAGFVARPSPAEVVERCGSCHADARFVRRQGASLQVDQLALFRQDPHGRALARGVTRAASCASCHGTHDVRPAHDPASRTHRARVADLCGGCHAAPARADGSREAPAALWHRSVHGEALARGDARAPTCASCHGRHGERVEAGGAAGACATCHAEQAQRSAQGPHGAAFARLGFGVCGPCHGAHDVAPAADRLLGVGGDAACTRCHASGQRAWSTAQRLALLRDEALADVRRAGDLVRRAREVGVEPAGAAADERALLAAESRMRSVVHGLDEAAMAEAAQATRVVAQRSARAARAALSRRGAERMQWLRALGPLGLLLALLLWKLRGLERRP
ncbi:MAG: cytochrome c3 family protein [Polyangiales bacterium]